MSEEPVGALSYDSEGGDRNIPVVGVFHRHPEPYLPLIREVIPDSHLRVCTRAEGLPEILDELDILLAFKFGFQAFPRGSILQAPRLRWVQLASAGIDHITPYDPGRLIVTNASGIHGDIMSQYVLGMLFHVLWDVSRLVDQQRDCRWQRYEVPSLSGRSIGIVGAGRVGAAIGRRAGAFGMRVLGLRRSGVPVEGFHRMYRVDGLADLLSESDVVVLTLPRTPETENSIGADELARMRPTAWLINVSRGGIVNEHDLIGVLKRNAIAGAILDVFAQEPLPPDSEFWTLPNVVVTPHISSELAGWPLELARLFCANLRRWMNNEPLQNVVDPTAGY